MSDARHCWHCGERVHGERVSICERCAPTEYELADGPTTGDEYLDLIDPDGYL